MPLEINPTTGELDKVNPKSASGTFALTDQVIPKGETYTIEIPLSRTDYKIGNILLYVPNAVVTAWKRAHAYLMFTTDINNAKSHAIGRTINMISLCVFYDWWVKGYAYEDDAFLSEAYYNTGANNFVRIESVQIVGNKIQLVLKNTNAVWPATVTIKGNYNVHA